MELMASTLHAVVSSSALLRDETLQELTASWPHERKRLLDPPDLGEQALGATSPSLFGGGTLLIVRCDENAIKRHTDMLLPLVGQPVDAGAVVLVTPKLGKREKLAKALSEADAYHNAAVPLGAGFRLGSVSAWPKQIRQLLGQVWSLVH